MKIRVSVLFLHACVFSYNCMVDAITKPITEEVYFYHYNNEHQNDSIELKNDEELNKNINRSAPWKFFIHGWTTSPWVSPWFQLGKDAYFQSGEHNIVFVDWSIPANKSYMDSVLNSISVGHVFGEFLIYLVNNDVKLSDMHLLGHSLGSHMAGFAGKHVRDTINDLIGRITALDPAGPFFERNPLSEEYLKNNTDQKVIFDSIMATHQLNPEDFLLPENWRISKNDANFVDVIHTDGSNYGMCSSIGDVDFFPNGGKAFQPGCENDTDPNCNHARSVYFFVESINSDNFVARECESYEKYKEGLCQDNAKGTMGEHTNHMAKGNFYLYTNSEPPFAQAEIC